MPSLKLCKFSFRIGHCQGLAVPPKQDVWAPWGRDLWRSWLCFCPLRLGPPIQHGVHKRHRGPLRLRPLGDPTSPKGPQFQDRSYWLLHTIRGISLRSHNALIQGCGLFTVHTKPWAWVTRADHALLLLVGVSIMPPQFAAPSGDRVAVGIIYPVPTHTCHSNRVHTSPIFGPPTGGYYPSPSTEGFLRRFETSTPTGPSLMSSLASYCDIMHFPAGYKSFQMRAKYSLQPGLFSALQLSSHLWQCGKDRMHRRRVRSLSKEITS